MITYLSVHKKNIHFIGILLFLIKITVHFKTVSCNRLLNYRHSFRFNEKSLLFVLFRMI